MTIRMLGRGLLAIVMLAGAIFAVQAAAPIETNLFAVSGVDVDVTDTDASTAKNKAIIEAQIKGFRMLVQRFAGDDALAKLGDISSKDAGRMLRSLSIEEEHTGPGRYIGKLTVRFLPDKVRAYFDKRGLPIVEDQSPPIVVIPVWKTAQGAVVWEDNPWKKAWTDLHAEQAIVPIIVPLGDLTDTQAITAEEALGNDEVKLESIMIRYEAKAILVAIAEAAPEGGVHAVMFGETPLGKVTFDKNYTADDGTLESSLALAAQRFHGVMLDKWRTTRVKIAAEERARRLAEQQALGPQTISISVPFASVIEWTAIRARLVNTPGVVRVDVSSIAGSGAMVRLAYANTLDTLLSSLAGQGLQLNQNGDAWILQAN